MYDDVLSTPDAQGAHPADRLWHGTLAQTISPMSPASLIVAYTDWLTNLNMYSGKQYDLAIKAHEQSLSLATWVVGELQGQNPEPCVEPPAYDKRFVDKEWRQWPYSLLFQSFLLQQNWWSSATKNIRGIQPKHEKLVNFVTRQALDVLAPSNFLLTNPKALATTAEEGGDNLRRGMQAYFDDVQRTIRGEPPRGAEDYPVGKRLAVTPGKVVYRNHLMELIQYSPSTDQVKPQPILFVPAWIMKYYILDLQPEDSLVKYMVDKGYTVFMISWKNPGSEDRNTTFEDYRKHGIMDALDAVSAIVPDQKIHSVGYCIGGTLLTVAAAHMARIDDERLQTMTLFASLADFTDAGELGVFIDRSQVAYLEDLMWQRGYLGGARMRGAFYFLRSLDLVWSRHVQEYLLGKPGRMFDVMAWNADTTNLPYRMHSEYLRRFYLNNDLVEARYEIDGDAVVLLDIRVPIFSVGTTRDHIAPWKSAYRINRLTRTEVTFALTSGGHNVGVVNPPETSRYDYQIHTRKADDKYLASDAFREKVPHQDGSWWPAWADWLDQRSDDPVAPPQLGAPDKNYPPLVDAPGTYVYDSARVF